MTNRTSRLNPLHLAAFLACLAMIIGAAVAPLPVLAQDGDEAANGDAGDDAQPEGEEAADAEAEEEIPEGMFATVTSIEGDPEDALAILPDGDLLDIAVGARFSEGTEVSTGDTVTVVLTLGGRVNGFVFQNAVMAVRPVSTIRFDRLLLEDDAVITRMRVRSGEVRVKITEEREEFSTDMKVATPNATASITGTDVSAIGYNANRGSYFAVASGSIVAERGNGTTLGVTGGTAVSDASESLLEDALSRATPTTVPIGYVDFEVRAGQIMFGGTERPASDVNNPSVNPASGRGGSSGYRERPRANPDDYDPLPSSERSGR